jgi:hypothetical protein
MRQFDITRYGIKAGGLHGRRGSLAAFLPGCRHGEE